MSKGTLPLLPPRPGWLTALLTILLLAAAPTAHAQTQRPQANVVEVIQKAGMFKTFLSGIGENELRARLSGEAPVTLLLPRDEAFEELDEQTRAALLDPEKRELLKQLILFHVVEEAVPSSFEGDKLEVASLSGEVVKLNKRGKRFTVNGNIRVIKADIPAKNGVIHVIDKVIIPPEFKVALKAKAKDEPQSDKRS